MRVWSGTLISCNFSKLKVVFLAAILELKGRQEKKKMTSTYVVLWADAGFFEKSGCFDPEKDFHKALNKSLKMFFMILKGHRSII